MRIYYSGMDDEKPFDPLEWMKSAPGYTPPSQTFSKEAQEICKINGIEYPCETVKFEDE